VKACVDAGFDVVPIPGANAAITALSAAGLPTDKFVFEGFLPPKLQQRREYLELLRTESKTLIFYESPHRLRATLQDLAEVFGGAERTIAIARELTKLYEEFWRGTLTAACEYYQTKEPQGEYTLVVEGNTTSERELSVEEIKAELGRMIAQGITRSQATKELAKLTSLPKRQLYQLALEIDI
jgi:16S rRNA (cytidine1402-2'-O)-methyltransferase